MDGDDNHKSGAQEQEDGWFTTVDDVLAEYYSAYFSIKCGKGRDLLKMLRLDEALERLLKKGLQPTRPIDDVLINMVETGSLRGVEICLAAGADPYVSDTSDVMNILDAMERAEIHERNDILAALKAYVAGDLYKQHQIIRQQNGFKTIYAAPDQPPQRKPGPDLRGPQP